MMILSWILVRLMTKKEETLEEICSRVCRGIINGKRLPVERLEKVPSLKELKTKAKECGLKGYYKMRKSELLKLLNKA